jgi:hypothetical protein
LVLNVYLKQCLKALQGVWGLSGSIQSVIFHLQLKL